MNLIYDKKDNSRISKVDVTVSNGNRVYISGQTILPDTNLSVLVKAVATQVIFDCGIEKKAPDEIWERVEEAWRIAKENSEGYKVINSSLRTDQDQSSSDQSPAPPLEE